jgi:hypothetical protein
MSLLTAPFRAPASETNSASHAYQICQKTNGRAGLPAEIHRKEGSPGCVHSFDARTRNNQLGHIKKGDTTPDCPAMMPRRVGTTPLSTARFPVALSPATALAAAVTITVFHRPVSRASNIAPSLVADRTPLHCMAALLSACSQHHWGRPRNTCD